MKVGDIVASTSLNLKSNKVSINYNYKIEGNSVDLIMDSPTEYEPINYSDNSIETDKKIYYNGDLNGDGFITSKDGTLLEKYLFEGIVTSTYDFNSDGFINNLDSLAISKYIVTHHNVFASIPYDVLQRYEIGQIADYNMDGKTNVEDLTLLQRAIKGDPDYYILNIVKAELTKKGYNEEYSFDELLEAIKTRGDRRYIDEEYLNTIDTYTQLTETYDSKYYHYQRILRLMDAIKTYIGYDNIINNLDTLDNLSYDINGDGVVNAKDENTLAQYLNSNHSMINNSGNFDDWTDYQNVSFEEVDSLMYDFNYLDIGECPAGTTISDIINKVNAERLNCSIEDLKNKKEKDLRYNTLKKNFGDYECAEICYKNSGMEAMVLKDKGGNYRIVYCSTKWNSKKDILYDAETFAGMHGIVYINQQNDAKELAYKYFLKAKQEGVHLSMQGYSLGGGLTESSYLFLLDQDDSDKVLNGIKLFNPLHNRLTKEQVKKLKETYGFDIYASEGDMVSTVNNYDDFKDVTQYLYLDNYETIIESQGEDIAKIWGKTHWTDYYIIGDNVTKAFAFDGSARSAINVSNSDINELEHYKVHGHAFEELYGSGVVSLLVGILGK